jgi:hypothetical protein
LRAAATRPPLTERERARGGRRMPVLPRRIVRDIPGIELDATVRAA